MFVFEFEKPLFEFVYERPHCEPLLALPPTFSSSTACTFSTLRQVFVSLPSSPSEAQGGRDTHYNFLISAFGKEEAFSGFNLYSKILNNLFNYRE